jgi:hypothetical protein
LPKQEVQKAWAALKNREQVLKQVTDTDRARQQQLQFNRGVAAASQQVRITPANH